MNFFEFFERVKQRLWSQGSALLLIRPAGKALDESKRKPSCVEFRPVTEDNIFDCAAFEDANRYVPVYREFLSRDGYVHFGYLDGKCVFRHVIEAVDAFFWEECLVRQAEEGEKLHYIRYGFCSPQARGKGCHSQSLFFMAEKYSDFDLYAIVFPDNYASLKGFFRSGFEVQSLITVKHRFFRRVLMEKVLSPEEKAEYESACL